MVQATSEPNDNHRYELLWFRPRTIELIRKGFARYQVLLEADLAALKADEILFELIGDVDSLPIAEELSRISGMGAWLDRQLAENGRHVVLNLDHGHIRLTKSVCMLYIRHLRDRRNALAQRAGTSTHLLSSIDSAIGSLEESMSTGVFQNASESPLLVTDVPSFTAPQAPRPSADAPTRATAPPAVLLPSIELLDSDLRSRCLDLYATFSEGGQHERFDTVLTEATRILEHRIRTLSDAPETTVGVELATFAFSGSTPKICVSAVASEQEAAHLMFRGLFGFIRNHVHHRLTGPIVPQRVLQILGMVDYMLSVAGTEGAERPAPPT